MLLIWFSTIALAQSKSEVFVTNDFDQQGGIKLKWIYEYVYHPNGFNIYRKEANTSWVKINNVPVKLTATLPSGHQLNQEEKGLLEAMQKSPYEEMKQSIIRAFALIKGIYNNELAGYLGIYYHDRTAEQGKTYQYKITMADSELELALSKDITCADYQKISPPEEIMFFRKKKYVTCNWKPDLYRYFGVDIYRKNADGGEFEKLTITGPIALQPRDVKNYKEDVVFFADTTIQEEINYVYKLVAIDYFGVASEFSAEISVPAQDFTPPGIPYGFKLIPSSTQKTVSAKWSSIDEVDLAGYNLYTSRNSEETFIKVNKELISKGQTAYLHEGVEQGGHYYIVSSVDFAGNESFSGMMYTELVDRTPPAAPKNLKTAAVSGEITLTWDANTEGDLKGYFVQKSLNDSNNLDNDYINVNAEPLTVATYTEKLPSNIKNKFVYRVIAVDTLYNRSKPSINSLAQMPDVVPPNQPVISNVKLKDGNILIEWIPNAEKDLLGYDLFRKVVGDSNSLVQININTIPGSVNAYTDRNFTEGEEYYYQVRAKDMDGNESAYSTTFKFRIPREKKQLKIDVEKVSFNKSKQQVTLQWEGPSEVDMRGYVIYMQDEYGTMKPVSGLSEYTEFKTKIASSEEPVEFEIRGYTVNGEVIKTERIAINKN